MKICTERMKEQDERMETNKIHYESKKILADKFIVTRNLVVHWQARVLYKKGQLLQLSEGKPSQFLPCSATMHVL